MAQTFACFIISAARAPLLQDGPVLSVGLLAVIAILLIILFIWLLLRWRAERPATRAVTKAAATPTPARPAIAPMPPVEEKPIISAAEVPAATATPASAVEVYPAPDAPVVETPAAAVPPFADDLEIIEGIGPKIAHVLNDAGVKTFAQLAQMDPEKISAILHDAGMRLADPRSWPAQARLAAAGDKAGLQALQDRLKAGRAS